MRQVKVGHLEVVMDVQQQMEIRRYTYNIKMHYEIGEIGVIYGILLWIPQSQYVVGEHQQIYVYHDE